MRSVKVQEMEDRMSDLISREQAKKLIREEGVLGSAWDDRVREDDVCNMLDSLPTAYDVEGVVEELEEPLMILEETVTEFCNECDCEIKCEGMVALNEIKKIVKRGGRHE